MKEVKEYLDALKVKFGSDYKVSKLMDIDRSVLSSIRRRNAISDENAIKVADLLKESHEEVLMSALIARSKGEVKLVLEKVARTAGYMILILSMTLTLGIICTKQQTSHNA